MEKEGDIIKPLKELMYGLIYPAVLGTGLVLTVLRAFANLSLCAAFADSSLYVAAIAGVFYSVSFASFLDKPPAPAGEPAQRFRYTWPAFLIDNGEVVLMFICFASLRLFDQTPENQAPKSPNLYWAYGALAIDVVWQCLWRLSANLKALDPLRLRAAVFALMVAGWIFGSWYWWINAIILGLTVLPIALYVFGDDAYYFRRQAPFLLKKLRGSS